MPGKSESSSAGKKSESAAKKPADNSQQGVVPAGAGYEAYLGDGQPGMDSLNAYLEGARSRRGHSCPRGYRNTAKPGQ